MSERPTGPARSRILDTATRLFYTEGVHSVGVDKIIAEAGVAKATFYHHFPSKDELVSAYVTAQSMLHRAGAAQLAQTADPLSSIFEFMCDFGTSAGYRGCPFINAAAEYPDPSHPVRRAIDDHRRWLRALFLDLLRAEDHPDAERTADILLLLRDGLVVGFDLDDPATVHAAVRTALDRVLQRSANTR